MIETLVKYVIDNKEWIFSGAGIVMLGWIGKFLFGRRHDKEIKNEVSVVNNVYSSMVTTTSSEVDMEHLKLHTFILFVDDQAMGAVDTLKQQGWKHTSQTKDVRNLSDDKVKQAHIIFVDINGVAKDLFPQKQGMGLADALKKKYPQKKIIIYSATRVGDRFDEELQNVDYCLAKDAEPYQFVKLVEKFAKEIYAEENRIK